MEILPTFNEPFASSQREAWANSLASALIQIRVQGKQSECRKKVLTALDIAQVLYDQQFVAYLKKTFLDDNGNNNNQNSCSTSNQGGSNNPMGCGTPSGSALGTGVASSPVNFPNTNQQENSVGGQSTNRTGERSHLQRELSFQKSFTPRQNFQQPTFQRQASQQGHGSPSGQTNQSHSGKSSMHKSQQPFNFQDRPKRQFFQPPAGNGSANPNNNDSSSTYSHNTNASQVTSQKPQQQFPPSMAGGQQSSNPAMRNLKRKTYDGRPKLDGAATSGNTPPVTGSSGQNQIQQQPQQQPFQAHKRFK